MGAVDCKTSLESNRASLVSRLFEPVDIASLVLFRIAFGAIMLWEVWRYFEYDRVERYYIDPQFFFTYEWFSWLKPWPGNGMIYHWIGMGVLSAAIMLGVFYRVCMALFFLAFTYIFLLDKANYLNHFYLISLISFIMIFLPLNRAMSVDAWLRPKLLSQTVPKWTLWLIQFQIAIPYVFGGIAKCNNDWLLGEPMRMWLADRTDFPVIGQYFTEEWMVYSMSYAGLLLDLFIVPFLIWKRTRIAAFVVALSFHLMNSQLFSIGIFPWFMIAATLMFFDPGWPRRLLPKKNTQASTTGIMWWSKQPVRWRRVTVALLAIYAFIQIALPFRHLLYPGNVSWTEEGHRFAWHMKLRSKRGGVLFYAIDRTNNRIWRIDHERYLTSRQRRKVATRPDMILQFSHFLADQIREAQGVNVEINAFAKISLNNRKPQLMIDPHVDLTQQAWTLDPATWILPLEQPLTSVAAQ